MKRGLTIWCLVLAIAGGAIHRLVTARRTSAAQTLHESTAHEAESGSLQGLLRARMGAVRLAVADANDVDLLAELAYLNAALAHHYGLPSAREAETFLQRLGPATPAAARAARVLLALEAGDWSAAETLAKVSAAEDPHDVRSRLALARLAARAGDPVGASRIAETAAVNAPEAGAARVEWAEARLDLGQAKAALDVLRDVVARAPEHTRARLLIAEAQQALEGDAAHPGDEAALTEACRRDGVLSPVIEAACQTNAATAARLHGDRAGALDHALAAAAITHDDPRTLTHTACVLAQLGQIDRAHDLVARAAQHARPRLPGLAWARLALALGRGQPAARPSWLRAGDPETVLLGARAAFATGGPAALRRAVAEAAPAASTGESAPSREAHASASRTAGEFRDPDLRALALLADAGAAPAEAGPGPVPAYALGMRARLAGDLDRAARWLGQALAGHGDACRAAGEYLVVMRLLRRPIEHELDALAASNHDCLNLALPPPRHDPKIKDPLHDTGVRRPKH
jgi:Tfp pilus assembly protein PilF